jgi:hypothetical protein
MVAIMLIVGSPSLNAGEEQATEDLCLRFSGTDASGHLPEKRKVGGSIPPLTTATNQSKRRLTCAYVVRCRFPFSGWLRLFTVGGWLRPICAQAQSSRTAKVA